MKDKKENKIKYFNDVIDNIDYKLISLLSEKLDISTNFYEFLFKNNLENKYSSNSIKSNISNFSENRELIKIFSELNKLSDKKYKKIEKKYNSKYAAIGAEDIDFKNYIFSELQGEDIQYFNLTESEFSNLLFRKNFYAYFLGRNYNDKIIKYLDNITDQAKIIGEINLVQKYRNRNFGFNTEYFALMRLFYFYKLFIENKSIAIIGAKNKSIEYALNQLKVRDIEYINLENLDNGKIYYQEILINTIDFDDINLYEKLNLDNFINLKHIVELSTKNVFTRLKIEAKDRNIHVINGIYKDIFQYKKDMEIIFRKKYSDRIFFEILDNYLNQNMNIVLVGMPGAGKTTVGRNIAKILGRKHIDIDYEFYLKYDIYPQEYLKTNSESIYREKEKKVIEEVGKNKGVVISTSGGSVSKMENYYHLKKNSIIFMIERKLSDLSTRNRPLSQGGISTLIKMKEDREYNYKYFTDFTFENKGNFKQIAYDIIDKFNSLKILQGDNFEDSINNSRC